MGQDQAGDGYGTIRHVCVRRGPADEVPDAPHDGEEQRHGGGHLLCRGSPGRALHGLSHRLQARKYQGRKMTLFRNFYSFPFRL